MNELTNVTEQDALAKIQKILADKPNARVQTLISEARHFYRTGQYGRVLRHLSPEAIRRVNSLDR